MNKSLIVEFISKFYNIKLSALWTSIKDDKNEEAI